MFTTNKSKEIAQNKIDRLVSRFEDQKDSYLKSGYNETSTRRDFIDPFFEALGWDIDNKNGYAESYREVIHEDRVKVGGANKAPDYSFRLVGGKRLFFVEAKKPSILIKDEAEPAFQVRRYGWSAKLPISIVTDFQEFAVYDCTKKPLLTDKASIARIKYITYTDYLNDFDFLWNTFSKERVLQGSFDKFIENDAYKKGSTTLDNEFLQSLDSWRTQLAVSISKNNRKLDEDEINFAVQQMIDRVIFLRIAEDRSIEPYGNLKDCIKEGNLYQNLYDVFVKADQKYNSGLFDFNKDKISHNLEIDNKVLKAVISELYFPCPYEFSVLPVEILGTAYEQFLGKQIKVDKAHKVTIEQKPEVRKAGGVYYTPQYIVDYIVENTIGKLIKGKTPKEISQLKVVDPACGSGSFLLGAFDYLLKYHKDYYTKDGKTVRGTKLDTLTPDGNLATAEKKRILLNNIYGVDIDANAVEVTKLSLLIKCMEGETEASIATQMLLFQDRVLPTLDNNIKSGNSLIDTDFYSNEMDFGDERKIKPFSWERSFPEVFRRGGFDVIIGNPPYVQPNTLNKSYAAYLSRHYIATVDLYAIFMEKSLQLLKDKSPLSFILPSLFIKGIKYASLRTIINENCTEVNIREYGDGVFDKVQMPTCVIRVIKGKNVMGTDHFKGKHEKLFQKVETIPLSDISYTRRGLEIGRDKLAEQGFRECLTGGNIDCFVQKKPRYISKENLKFFSKSNQLFSSPKIVTRETGATFVATIDYKSSITTRSIYNTHIINENYQPEYILGIMNSNLFKFYFKEFISPDTKVFPKIRITQLNALPIPKNADSTLTELIARSVKQIIELKGRAIQITLHSQLEQLVEKIRHLEKQLNGAVFQAYGLIDEEIEIVESSFEA